MIIREIEELIKGAESIDSDDNQRSCLIGYLKSISGLLADRDGLIRPKKTSVFKVAVCGHFSTGKSSFINAVIGTDLCPVDSKISTHANTRFFYGKPAIYQISDGRKRISTEEYQSIVQGKQSGDELLSFEVYLENPRLKKFVFIDTPGRGASDRAAEDIEPDEFDGRSTDDVSSAQACEDADCIIYLSHPKNIHEEDEEFLRSPTARKKPVLVVMPKVDKCKANAPKLVEAYRNALSELGEENPNLSRRLFCCGGFSKKNPDPVMKKYSIEDLVSGLDDLYGETLLRQEQAMREYEFKVAKIGSAIKAQLDKIDIWLDNNRQSPDEMEKLEEQIKSACCMHNGVVSWGDTMETKVLEVLNKMIRNFVSNRRYYCCRVEANWHSNRAYVDVNKISKRVEAYLVEIESYVDSRLGDALACLHCLPDSAAYKKIQDIKKELIKGIRDLLDEAVHFCHAYPGDDYYFFNSDVDRVGQNYVASWANGTLLTSAQKIVVDGVVVRCAQEIDAAIQSIVGSRADACVRRDAYIKVLSNTLEKLRKEL